MCEYVCLHYEVEVISIGKRDSKRAIEVITMLRISFKKVKKRIETEDEDKRGKGVSLEYATGHDERFGYP